LHSTEHYKKRFW